MNSHRLYRVATALALATGVSGLRIGEGIVMEEASTSGAAPPTTIDQAMGAAKLMDLLLSVGYGGSKPLVVVQNNNTNTNSNDAGSGSGSGSGAGAEDGGATGGGSSGALAESTTPDESTE